ncbi:MAG TPA: hypothetical protein VG206_04760 [Terriglobia bacterium]|nr:hypothetical protein [Terriglobia bacterium]
MLSEDEESSPRPENNKRDLTGKFSTHNFALSGADLDRRCREAVAEGKLSRTYAEYDFEHRLTHVNAENVNISKSMWDMKLVLASFFGMMTDPKVLDVAGQFCGPELIASSVYRLRPKVPSHSWSPVPWHQDSG